MNDKPILYSFRRCPYAMRARLAWMISGMTCEIREVKLSAKPEAMLEISPKGTVPVLLLADGKVVEQSLDIMRWALGQSDPEGWLQREDGDLIARNDGEFKQHLDHYKYPERHGSDPLEARTKAGEFLMLLNARLAAHGQLVSKGRGLADMAIMPFVRQFSAVDRAWFDAQPWPDLRAWLDGHLESALFASIMLRLKPWSEGDAPIAFGAAHRSE